MPPPTEIVDEALDRLSREMRFCTWVNGFGKTQAAYPDGPGEAVVVYLNRGLTAAEAVTVPARVVEGGFEVLVTTEVVGMLEL